MSNPVLVEALPPSLKGLLPAYLVPVVVGRGVRLLEGLEPGSVELDLVRVVDAPGVTHLTYRVRK